MSRVKYKPFNLDMNYELETYKHIGKDYGDAKNANKGLSANFLRFVRRWTNRNQVNYKICNTYSDWEAHVECVLNKKIRNYSDMIHWLTGRKRFNVFIQEAVKSVIIPIYIAIFSLYDGLGGREILERCQEHFKPELSQFIYNFCLCIVLVFITIMALCILYDSINKVHFYEDFICIAKEQQQITE